MGCSSYSLLTRLICPDASASLPPLITDGSQIPLLYVLLEPVSSSPLSACAGSSVLCTGFLQLLCVGFSWRWLLLLQSTGSRVHGFSSYGTQAQQFQPQPLEHGLSSYGTQACLPHSMRSLPRPEVEPMSPDLGGTSLIAQLVKNLPECRRPQFDSWVGKSHWRRDRLPTPVF